MFLFQKDFKSLLTNKFIKICFILVLIILIISTFWYVKIPENKENGNEAKISVGIIDQDESIYSRMLLSYFIENPEYGNYLLVTKVSEEDMWGGEAHKDVYLTIPKDFMTKMIQIEHSPIQATIKTKNVTKTILIKNLLQSFENYIKEVEVNCVALYELMEQHQINQSEIDKINERISYELILTVLGKDAFFETVVVKDLKTTSLTTYYGYELLFFLICYVSIGVGIQCLKEKKVGLFARLATTKTSFFFYFFEKAVFSSLVMSVCLFVMNQVIAMIFHRGIDFPTLFYLMCIIFLTISFFLLLAVLLPTIKNYVFVSNAILLFGAIIGAGVLPMMYLGEGLQRISKVSFHYWYLKAILLCDIRGGLPTLTYIALLVSGVGVLYLSSYLLKKRGYYSAGH